MTELPKFIISIGISDEDRDYIVHTESPRFILFNSIENREEFSEIEMLEEYDDGKDAEKEMDEIMVLAEEAFNKEIDKLEALDPEN